VSYRYGASYLDPGLNTLVAPTGSYQYNLFTWGSGLSGGLGLGNTTYYSSPKQVGSLTNWLNVTAGVYFGIAIKTDGTLWAWGQNSSGQLGLGTRTSYSSPKQVGALTNWLNSATTYSGVLAVKKDGTLWAWGNNQYGQLGLGNTTYYSSPKQVGSLTNWSFIAGGGGTVQAIKKDGTLWAWGNNVWGQIGINNIVSYSSPKQVGALTTWKYVAASDLAFTLAVKTDGTLWSWGVGGNGTLGLGNTTNYSSPKQVGSLTNWSVVCGTGVAVKTDGTLWSWGYNNYGELGLNNTTKYSSPVQVGALTNWLSVSSGGYWNSFAIKTNGTLWSWGRNLAGALGLNNITSYSSPIQVGSSTTWKSISATTRVTMALG